MLLHNWDFRSLLAQGGNQNLDPFPIIENHNSPPPRAANKSRGLGNSLKEIWVGKEGGKGIRGAQVSEGIRG